ncbi:MAG: hypothetical protein ACLFQJ_08040 [Campylobacterales bacterium]
MTSTRIPLWIKVAYTILVCIIVPIYWHDLGWENFLWFSDIALITLVVALWVESRLLASIQAVSVLFLELAWTFDFVTGGYIIGIAAYMFTDEFPIYIRIISAAFHLVLPPLLIYSLMRLGYDPRALPLQALIALVVLILTYWLSEPSENINWVYGLNKPQETLPPMVYLGLLYIGFVLVIYLPSHLLFRRLFTKQDT